jgi:poly-gamma-glutamate capsule biosynthesis protein CapA/YwtB (metallophosphatase superfamily)
LEGEGDQLPDASCEFPAITAAGIDICTLANNHVLDWGYEGLEETLRTLNKSGVKGAGAGRDLVAAATPATVEVPGKGRVHVFSFGDQSSGIPPEWGAARKQPGVNLLPDLSDQTAQAIGDSVRKVKEEGDVVIASIHWGGNWGFDIPGAHRRFAHRLIDSSGIDIIHGHSSHHVKGIEIYRDKPIIYGCGDFITDYEGIGSHKEYRGDLGLMYFAYVNALDGRLKELRLIPTRMRRFQVTRPSTADVRWLRDTLNREGKAFDTGVEGAAETLSLTWVVTSLKADPGCSHDPRGEGK